jgi:hypothetical protein
MTKSTILLSLMALVLCNACSPTKYCEDTAPDITVSILAFSSNPIIGSPLKNVPFVLNITTCLPFGQSLIKLDTVFTNDRGRIDTILKNQKVTCTEVTRCTPKINISQIALPKFVRWGYGTTDNRFEYKESMVLKVQIKHDSTDVSSLFLAVSQGGYNNLKLVDTRTTATNKTPINLTQFFNIAKGEDTELNIQFDKKLVRTDTIKASQLDTIFKIIVL